MTMMELTNVPFGGVGKGDGNCNGNSDGNSNSGGNAFNNQQMLQAVMECRGGLSVEEGAMVTTMESTNIPFGGVGKGDGNCNCNSDGKSDNSEMHSTINKCCRQQWNGGGADHGEGGNDEGNDGIDKRPIRVAMAMVMAMATATVAAAVGRWRPQWQPQPPLRWQW